MELDPLLPKLPFHILDGSANAYLKSSKPKDGKFRLRYESDENGVLYSVEADSWQNAYLKMKEILEGEREAAFSV